MNFTIRQLEGNEKAASAPAMMTIREFGREVSMTLQQHLSPWAVAFRGSFASGEVDEYSDVDLRADVHQHLDQIFFDSLLKCLRGRFGALSVRYDPDHRDNAMAQGLRISLYDYPVFWRIDLDIASDRPCPRKWPDPFPEWSTGQSAFWNVVWAVKHGRRGKPAVADHYMSCACGELRRHPTRYSEGDVLALLADLGLMDGTDKILIGRLRETVGQPVAGVPPRRN